MSDAQILNEDMSKIVAEVLRRVTESASEEKIHCGALETSVVRRSEVETLVERAKDAQALWHERFNIAAKSKVISKLREDLRLHVEELAKLALEDTGMGRLDDKILKKKLAIDKTPGPEYFTTKAVSGDHGLVLEELSPFGVIASICPSTNPVASVINNAICMISGGNAVVFAPHPGAVNCTQRTIELVTASLRESGVPDGLVSSLQRISMTALKELMTHPNVNMISATGGPEVVAAALSSGKTTIGAGPGNPPVLVDETAHLERAAIDIIAGCSFDNNLPCIAEKELIVVNCVADELKKHLLANGAFEVKEPAKIEALRKLVLTEENKVNKKWVGKCATEYLREIGYEPGRQTRLVLVETDEDHPFAQVELLMPILPMIRVPDFQKGLAAAKRLEHGFRHSACIHSTNIDNMSRMAREMQTTMFVKNAPSLASIGVGGDCPAAFTIATSTGQGPTTPMSFCRLRRCVLHGSFRIV